MASPAQQGQPEPPHPALKAMLVCDQAIREAATNKVTLVGIFDRVFSSVFPFDWVRGVGRVRFERPGKYEFRFFANGRYLGGATLDVVQVEGQRQ